MMSKYLTRFGFLVVLCEVCVTVTPRRAYANIVGIGTQNFNTIPNGLDFITVHSSETLDPGIINTGLFFNYAINTLPYFDSTETGRLTFKDGLLSADFNFAIGLLENWDMGFSFPAVLAQNDQDTGYRGEFVNPGFTEIRWLTKYKFWGDHSKGVAAVLSINWNRVQNDPMSGTGAGPTTNIEIVGDKQIGPVGLGLNLGFRFRNPGAQIEGFPIAPLKNQFIFSLAGSYLIPHFDTKIISEIYAGFPLQSQDSLSDRSNSAAELILGLKYDYSHSLALHAGMGTELVHARSSPDWRIYSGLNYVFGPVWKGTFRSTREGNTFVISNIEFYFDSDEMTPFSQKSVEELVQELQKAPGFRLLTIEGHTDSVGKAEYNKMLSFKRAAAIKKYLVKVHGFDEKKITALGIGEEKPISDNGNFQGRQKNRRVEFKLTRNE
jgi:outer membrane protein OmpA-like peptidoglycan-associated protein